MKKIYFLFLLWLTIFTEKQIVAHETKESSTTLASYLTQKEIDYINDLQYNQNRFSFMSYGKQFHIFFSPQDTFLTIQKKLEKLTGIPPQKQTIKGQPITFETLTKEIKYIYETLNKINSEDIIVYDWDTHHLYRFIDNDVNQKEIITKPSRIKTLAQFIKNRLIYIPKTKKGKAAVIIGGASVGISSAFCAMYIFPYGDYIPFLMRNTIIIPGITSLLTTGPLGSIAYYGTLFTLLKIASLDL